MSEVRQDWPIGRSVIIAGKSLEPTPERDGGAAPRCRISRQSHRDRLHPSDARHIGGFGPVVFGCQSLLCK